MTNSRGKKSAVAVSILAGAVFFTAFSFFRTAESVSLAPSQTAINKIGYGFNVDESDLEAVIAAREGGFWFGDRARIHSDAALARILLAEQTEDAGERQVLLEAAEETSRPALK